MMPFKKSIKRREFVRKAIAGGFKMEETSTWICEWERIKK